MIDLHSHVLPALDDGAQTLDDALAMLEAAAGAGTTEIVATPHADTQYRFQPELTDQLVADLNIRLQGRIRIHAGCELHLTHDNVQEALAHPRRYAIGHRTFVLVELSNLTIFPNTGDLFARLEGAGLNVVIPHPECNPLLRRRPELIEEWVVAGRYMQLTAQSVTGGRGENAQRFCRALIERNLAHFVASDTHDLVHRPPSLQPAREWLQTEYGAEMAARLLVDNPGKALRGEPFPPPPPESGKKRSWWNRVWSRTV
jgi:protein-tyrosine phosphatase